MSIDAYLWRAYSNVRLKFLAAWECQRYVIITACNPRSSQVSREINCIKNLQLERDVARFSYQYVKVGDPDFDWVEDSFAVEMPLTQGCDLAQVYEQNAIYFVENGVLFLVSCDQPQRQTNLGPLSQFVY